MRLKRLYFYKKIITKKGEIAVTTKVLSNVRKDSEKLQKECRCAELPQELYPNDDEIVSLVRRTKDYSKFNLINVNRDKNEQNLKNLTESLAEEAFNKPILVTYDKDNPGKYWVEDGQHTLHVRKALGLWVYYELLTYEEGGKVTSELSDAVIERALCSLNASGKNWSIEDFVKYYAERDFDGTFKAYTLLLKLMQKYPDIKHIQPYILLGQGHFRKNTGNKGGQYGYIKKGRYEFADWDLSCRRADALMVYIQKLGDILKDTNFKLAIVRIIMMGHISINHEKFAQKILSKRALLMSFRNMEDYFLILTDIYNSGLRDGTERVNFGREYRRLKTPSVRDSVILEEKKQIKSNLKTKK